ncbi:MAG TPA: hypothetical protein VE954_41870 [Oligoflexus sp.]|uniref:hypothetical protein n=1 Tax=Oligoflexus sp. TaxID=1971216 RepID=UPI002D649A0D|nr:hypothetical protein [Oligoflexus sp.]HYX39691.1 hypothetical protein [Oligoflexus sp.]
MKKVLLVTALLIPACGKDKDDRKEARQLPESNPESVQLIQGLSEASFWDYSSEIRCDGLKEYLSEFGKQRIENGSITAFNCFETAPGSESFVAAVEMGFDEQKALMAITINRQAANVAFCNGEYKPDPIDMRCSEDQSNSAPSSPKMVTLKNELPALLKITVGAPQSKNLINGLPADDFYKSALVQLDSSDGVVVPFEGQEYRFFLGLTASGESPAKGKLVVEKIEPASGYQLFGCSDANCLSQKTFDYQIRHHWFTFASDGKMSAFIIPKALKIPFINGSPGAVYQGGFPSY